MSKILNIIVFISLLFFVGCGTKREYFEPKKVYADIVYTGKLPAPIQDVSRYGAMLENRQIITEKGLSNIILDEGFRYLGQFDDRIISTNDNGLLHVRDNLGKIIYEKQFDRVVVIASVYKDRLALIDADNALRLVNMSEDKEYFINKQDSVYALDSRVAAPYFLNLLVIFPTLDGKLVIVDWKKGKLIRDVVISSERFFNNILFLEVSKDRLIAASGKRAISISPKKTSFLDENIRDVLLVDNNIVVMSNDGRVIILDEDLNILREKKFLFAVFVGAMSDGTLYIAERNGHLITTDLNFDNVKIYALPDKIRELLYMSNDTIYYDDSLTKLHSD